MPPVCHENPDYLSQQLVTYLGNKRALLDFIGQALGHVKAALGKEKLALGDLFSGSGVVSRYFKAHASRLVTNDIEGYAQTLGRCYLSNSDQRDEAALRRWHQAVVEAAQSGGEEGFIARLYAPRDPENIRPGERVFYTPRNARYLDAARQMIETLPEHARPFLIAPLLSEASVKTNTAGVFKGFYKNSQTGLGQFGGDGKNALGRIMGEITLPFPVFSRFDCPVEIYQQDAGVLADSLRGLDLVYLDPPYNQHPYGSNYFMLNLIDRYREPERLSRVSGIPAGWTRSEYNKSGRALETLSRLCARLDAPYLLISFNSEGFITPEQMSAMLGRLGRVETFRRRYNTFRGSRNLRERQLHTEEYLFLLRKGRP